jgi:tRNA nucleotidyltransferase (CCA-adding enzyme)
MGDETMIKLPTQVDRALELLGAAGYEAFVVGGAVRDLVRGGRPVQDWDLTTNALPDQIQSVFQGYRRIETGLKHGTVTVVLDEMPLEITTYRVDGGYSDHRHPDWVHFTRSLREDLERRDFTMNALAYHPKTGLVDLVGGQADLSRRVVRCVGDPQRRFREDALRILRALRFASVFEMQIESETAAAIHSQKHLLRDITAERIQAELTRLLCGAGVAEILRDFSDVLAVPLPELAPMFGFAQQNPHHDRDVWEHTIAVVSRIQPEPDLRWAALLHDVGKPSCFTVEDGVGHFYGHAAQSTELAGAIFTRLKFDHDSRSRILRLIRYHDQPLIAERKPVRRLLNKHGPEAVEQLIELHRADTLGQSSLCLPRLDELEQICGVVDELLREDACFSLKNLAVNGNDMIALGKTGQEIGLALQECLNAVIDERVPNEREALLAWIRADSTQNFG